MAEADGYTVHRFKVPAGFLGGLLGGAVTGIVLELLGFRLEAHQTARAVLVHPSPPPGSLMPARNGLFSTATRQ